VYSFETIARSYEDTQRTLVLVAVLWPGDVKRKRMLFKQSLIYTNPIDTKKSERKKSFFIHI
jgi:hypothetical protein